MERIDLTQIFLEKNISKICSLTVGGSGIILDVVGAPFHPTQTNEENSIFDFSRSNNLLHNIQIVSADYGVDPDRFLNVARIDRVSVICPDYNPAVNFIRVDDGERNLTLC